MSPLRSSSAGSSHVMLSSVLDTATTTGGGIDSGAEIEIMQKILSVPT